MHKGIVGTSFFLVCLTVSLAGQGFTGKYVLSEKGVIVTLVLQQDAQGVITGNLSSTKGTSFRIEGQIEEDIAVGLCHGEGGAVYFEAELEGNSLLFSMINLDENSAPDAESAKQLRFTRQATAAQGFGTETSEEKPGGRGASQPASPPRPAKTAGKPARPAEAVRDSPMGISFSPPPGWKAQKQGNGFILGSDTDKGFILIMEHAYTSLDQMNEEASQGLIDEANGIELVPSSVSEPFQKNGLAAEFQGVVQGKMAKAYALGLLSPHGGGVTILAAVEEASYTEAYPRFVREIASSLAFSAPQTDSSLMRYFAGKYYSYSGGSTITGSAGTERQVMLCPNGRYFDSSEFSASGQGWGGAQQANNAARWKIQGNKSQGTITIVFPGGETRSVRYQVTGEEGVIIFDGVKFAYAGAPECGSQ